MLVTSKVSLCCNTGKYLMKTLKFLRMNDVLRLTGVRSRSTIHNWMNAGTFPKSTQISPRMSVWESSSIEKWQQEVIK